MNTREQAKQIIDQLTESKIENILLTLKNIQLSDNTENIIFDVLFERLKQIESRIEELEKKMA